MLDLRPSAYDHPDAVRLIAQLQAFYRERYGDGDDTPVAPAEFAPPRGHFTIAYVGDEAVGCGGWRARDAADDPHLLDGDAEIKRTYVAPAHRGKGYARMLLAELEATAAAAGRTRVVLETGLAQPEAIALYVSSGYVPVPRFGIYRDEEQSRCFSKALRPVRPF